MASSTKHRSQRLSPIMSKSTEEVCHILFLCKEYPSGNQPLFSLVEGLLLRRMPVPGY